jgi:hypothetical protein
VNRFALILAVSFLAVFAPSASAGNIFTLNDWCANVNSDTGTCNDPNTGLALTGNAAVDLSMFDSTTAAYGSNNLGSITVTLGPGAGQNVDFYADYDVRYIEFLSNNDNASTTGTLASGQSYEIGDPNVTGDSMPTGFTLFDDFANDTLSDSNTLGTPGSDPQCCDVAFAMGLDDISVGDGGSATVTFDVSTIQPTSGFFITQSTNSDEGGSLYLSADVEFDQPTPEPSTFLLGAGAIAIGGFAARRSRARSSRV